MKKTAWAVIACLLGLALMAPAYGQTATELKQQLEAQKRINELLKQRIRTLEKKLATRPAAAVPPAPPPPPAPEEASPEENRALERALVRRGLALLPPGQWELTPGLQWAHNGSDAFGTQVDNYAATLDARVGLPWGTMAGVAVPYFLQADQPAGSNSGFGDLSFSLWKQFLPQGASTPSVVGSLGYRAPTGEDSGPVPLGSEFHQLTAGLSASKAIDPVVLSGGAFYSHAFSKHIQGVDIQPGDTFGGQAVASLAVTPQITGSVGLNLSVTDKLQRDGVVVDGTRQTLGFVELGTGFVLSRRLFFTLFTDVGITADAPDFIIGASLPMRF